MTLYIRRLTREPLESAHVVLCGEDGLILAAPSVHQDGSPVNISKVLLDAVVFSDGEFSGPDTVHLFDYFSRRVDAIREFALSALGDITQIETTAMTYHGLPLKERAKAQVKKVGTGEEAKDQAAEEPYGIQQAFGIEAARQAAYRLSQIPKLWKGASK